MSVHYNGFLNLKGKVSHGLDIEPSPPEDTLGVFTESLAPGIDLIAPTSIINNQQNSYAQYATFGPSKSSGKRYFEALFIEGANNAGSYSVGIAWDTSLTNSWLGNPLGSLGFWGYGQTFGPNATTFGGGPSFGKDDTVNFAVDIDNSLYWVGVNGVWKDDPDSMPGRTYPAEGNNIVIASTMYNLTTSVKIIGNDEEFAYPIPATCVSWAAL